MLFVLECIVRLAGESRKSTPQQVLSKLLFYLASVLNNPFVCQEESLSLLLNANKKNIDELVPNSDNFDVGIKLLQPRGTYHSVVGVVLAYREYTDILPWSVHCRIEQMLHYKIPLHLFDATILFRSSPSLNSEDEMATTSTSHLNDYGTSKGIKIDSCLDYENCFNSRNISNSTQISQYTPSSFPASPLSRLAVLADFTDLADNTLYRARDELRARYNEPQEHGQSASWHRRFSTFSASDSHHDIILSCAMHCAAKIGKGLYRTVRTTVPLVLSSCGKKSAVYVEYSIQCRDKHRCYKNSCEGGLRVPQSLQTEQNPTKMEPRENKVETFDGKYIDMPASLCIGVSTKKSLAVNTMVGSSKQSIGLHSSGSLISGSIWHMAVHSNHRSRVHGRTSDTINHNSSSHQLSSDSIVSFDAKHVEVARFGCGDIVGVLVKREGLPCNNNATKSAAPCPDKRIKVEKAVVSFFLNGEQVVEFPPSMLQVQICPDEDLYPTLSLYSTTTKVFGHFSADDISAAALKMLPSATHLPVRALDGSFIANYD